MVDQVTKSVVRAVWNVQESKIVWDSIVGGLVSYRASSDSIPVLGELLKLTVVHNQGAAFGIFPGYQPMFVATSILVLVVITAFWVRMRPRAWPIVLGLALVIAGAAGNLVDRMLIGTVTDFFHIAIIDFPVFNIADMSVLAGVFLLVAWLLFGPQPDKDADEETPLSVAGSQEPVSPSAPDAQEASEQV